MKNCVFIATSIDGYIADRNGNLDWLDDIPNPNQDDMGYYQFYEGMDALVMGRKTFEKVLSFDVDWPYDKPVFVLSNSLSKIPATYSDKAFLLQGNVTQVLSNIHHKGHQNLYIDGGYTITKFLEEDLIDEMIITTMPIILGAGIPLFGKITQSSDWQLNQTQTFLSQVVQNHYTKKR